MTTTAGAFAQALRRWWRRLWGTKTGHCLVFAVYSWETKTQEGSQTWEPFLGYVTPQVSYLLTMS